MYMAHPVSIALIQVHFPLAGQFSGPACINCRALPKALLQPQCICTLQTEYEIFRRHTAPGDGLLGNAENLVRSHVNPILLNCRRVTMVRLWNHKRPNKPQFFRPTTLCSCASSSSNHTGQCLRSCYKTWWISSAFVKCQVKSLVSGGLFPRRRFMF